MAHLDHWSPRLDLTVTHQQTEDIKDDLNRFFWAWYEAHKDDVLAKIRVLFWTKTVLVSDIRFLFEMLFGEPRPL